ncbi:MAG: hypothetical protein KAU22_02085, partial [Desulfuromonadales bacterium]|nr:hypothetical protein [Desulfuromonadales bacterium]
HSRKIAHSWHSLCMEHELVYSYLCANRKKEFQWDGFTRIVRGKIYTFYTVVCLPPILPWGKWQQTFF